MRQYNELHASPEIDALISARVNFLLGLYDGWEYLVSNELFPTVQSAYPAMAYKIFDAKS